MKQHLPKLWVGFDGPTLPHWLADCLASHEIDGVMLLGGPRDNQGREQAGRNLINLDQVHRLCTSIQACRQDTVPIAIDCEGGRVTRLAPLMDGNPWPSARAIGQMTTEEARPYYDHMAQTLCQLGITHNFAPCIDVHDERCPIIGALERAYGKSSDTIVSHARVMIEALLDAGVTPVLKHFPGHGRTSTDTHLEIVDAESYWQSDELKPYEALLSERPLAVMLAHTINRHIDPSGLPMSLSPAAVTWLRERQPEVMTITDALDMKAIAEHFSATNIAKRLCAAGVDIALHGRPSPAWVAEFKGTIS